MRAMVTPAHPTSCLPMACKSLKGDFWCSAGTEDVTMVTQTSYEHHTKGPHRAVLSVPACCIACLLQLTHSGFTVQHMRQIRLLKQSCQLEISFLIIND